MSKLMAQYEYNVRKGPFHEDISALPVEPATKFPVRYIAYYLPQFHPIEVNDDAWGAGFTEWTNTTKALPRYLGHYQPRMPADLGFYNLENVDVIAKQADLAARGGIYGFCIHYYWFSGRKVLDKPLSLILSNPQINIRFCINWANENWTRRWDGRRGTVLLKQDYNDQDPTRFAEDLIPIVGDERYIRINGRPLIMLYRANLVPDIRKTTDTWREVLNKAGLGNPYIIMPQTEEQDDPRHFGLDGAAGFPPHKFSEQLPNHRRKFNTFDVDFVGKILSYDKMMANGLVHRPEDYPYFPGVCPDWDNEARIQHQAMSFHGSTPKKYGQWLDAASRQALNAASAEERIVFINAWNEWAEGAYLEPDRHYGFAHLAETRRIFDAISHFEAQKPVERRDYAAQDSRVAAGFAPRPRSYHQVRNIYFALRRRLRVDAEKA